MKYMVSLVSKWLVTRKRLIIECSGMKLRLRGISNTYMGHLNYTGSSYMAFRHKSKLFLSGKWPNRVSMPLGLLFYVFVYKRSYGKGISKTPLVQFLGFFYRILVVVRMKVGWGFLKTPLSIFWRFIIFYYFPFWFLIFSYLELCYRQ